MSAGTLVVPATPRLHRRAIALGAAAKVVVLVFIATIVISMIRTAIAPSIIPAIVSSQVTLFATTRFGAEAVNNTAASSAETRAFAVFPILRVSSRSGTGAGRGAAIASASACILETL